MEVGGRATKPYFGDNSLNIEAERHRRTKLSRSEPKVWSECAESTVHCGIGQWGQKDYLDYTTVDLVGTLRFAPVSTASGDLNLIADNVEGADNRRNASSVVYGFWRRFD